MLMVIFGAGASYDSSPDFQPTQPQSSVVVPGPGPAPRHAREAWRPPLTNELFLDATEEFGAVVLAYPELRGILPFLRRPQSGKTVEQQLELYLDEATSDQARARQLLSVRYYLHDLVQMVSDEWFKRTRGVTNYAALIEQIRHFNTSGEPVCAVTFNYDLLLDHAIFPSGFASQSLEEYSNSHTMFKLFKPHGSVDWARFVAGPPGSRYVEASRVNQFPDAVSGPRTTPQQLIERAPTLILSSQYVRANPTDPAQMFRFNCPIVPAIAIPVQTKTESTFEWPESHRTHFEQLLPHVTKILIVGWQAKEAHFLKLLRQKLATEGVTQLTHVQAIGRDTVESKRIAEQFVADIDRRVKNVNIPARGGFSGFVDGGFVDFFYKS